MIFIFWPFISDSYNKNDSKNNNNTIYFADMPHL